MTIEVTQGWGSEHRQRLARLYEEAFGPKFQQAISSKEKRVAVLAKCFVSEYSFVAFSDDHPLGLQGSAMEQVLLLAAWEQKAD